MNSLIKSRNLCRPNHLLFILLSLCIHLAACRHGSAFHNEEYTEIDTLNWLHPQLGNLKVTYAEIGEFDLPVPRDQVYRMYCRHARAFPSSLVKHYIEKEDADVRNGRAGTSAIVFVSVKEA